MITTDDIAATAKLAQYASQGIGGIAHAFLAPWIAKREGKARIAAAESDAKIRRIEAEVDAEIQEALLPDSSIITGNISFGDQIQHTIRYETARKISNVRSVVTKAAEQLEGKTVPDKEPDPDFVSMFFNYAQNVSSEQFQILWAKVLAGEVKHPGSVSLHTLRILRGLDKHTAECFKIFCSLCLCSVVIQDHRVVMTESIRVLTIGRNPGNNEFVDFNLFYSTILHLREYGLIQPEVTIRDQRMNVMTSEREFRPLWYQDRYWSLKPVSVWNPDKEINLQGMDISIAGWQLAHVVDSEPVPEYLDAMKEFFRTKQLELVPWSLEED